MPSKKKISRLVPELVLDRLNSLNYKNIEHLYVICDMITSITVFKNNQDYNYGYVDIARIYFTSVITKHILFDEAKKFLIDNNIIECDNIFNMKTGKAFGYRFKKELISKCVPVYITKPTLFKRIVKNINAARGESMRHIEKSKEYFLSTFKIDFKAALKYINDEYEETILSAQDSDERIKIVNKYNAYYSSIDRINNGELYYKKNSTNGRVDTNLTALRTDLKKFIIIKDLEQLDISNSQPFFLYLLIEKNVQNISDEFKKEIEKYKNWVLNGKFYENFQNSLSNLIFLSRPQVKDIVFCILFGKNDSYINSKNISYFSKIFPNIYKFIYDYKIVDYKKLSNDLTRIESDFCIDYILPILNENKLNSYTVHDSWLLNKLDMFQAKTLIEDSFNHKFGVCPKLKHEKIN